MGLRPYIVHRVGIRNTPRPVTHRATGRPLGSVGEHCREFGQFRWWSAWLPAEVVELCGFDDGAINGDPGAGMHAAVEQLFHPEIALPGFERDRCQKWHDEQTTVIGRPAHPDACPDCESYEAAELRHRTAHPEQWVHHDWLVSLETAR